MNTHLDSFFSLYAIKKIYLCTKEITMNDQTVICAIATAPGRGAIAVIRLSGKGCIEICDRIFVSPSYKKLVDVLPNTIHFGKIVNKEELRVPRPPLLHRRRLHRNFLPWFSIHSATHITTINLLRSTACRPRRIYSTGFLEW